MLLNQLRRAAQAHDGLLRSVEHGLDVGYQDRDEGHAPEAEARIIEDQAAGLRAFEVEPAPDSGFGAFLDGIQRARVKLYHGPIPIVYGYGAAVVRKRAERRMTAHPAGLLEEQEALFFPFRMIAPELLERFGFGRDQMIDTSPAEPQPLPLFPPALYTRAAQAVDRWRESIERKVASRWVAATDASEWLLADGTLTIAPELAACPRAAGLITSHRTHFFDGDDARTLLGLRAGQRTSVFEPLTRRWTPVHSWYLRLRDPTDHDVLWGLVRIEIAARRDSPRFADQVSSWLLAELSPLALPDARWDRLLYALHDCEQFLRARAPSV